MDLKHGEQQKGTQRDCNHLSTDVYAIYKASNGMIRLQINDYGENKTS
jgi:hypothetical protein